MPVLPEGAGGDGGRMMPYAVKWIETGQFLVDQCPENVLTAEFDDEGAAHAREADAWTALNRIENDAGKTLAVVPVNVVEENFEANCAKLRLLNLKKWTKRESWGIAREIWIDGALDRIDLFEGFTNGDEQHWNRDAWFDEARSYWQGSLEQARDARRKMAFPHKEGD